jgi:hypothetical protein
MSRQDSPCPTPCKTGYVFNEILASSKSPESFKSGILTPVLKRDKDPALVNNYRGITVTAVNGKTFENCLLEKLSLVNESELLQVQIHHLIYSDSVS